MPIVIKFLTTRHKYPGGSVKRSLAMAFLGCGGAIAKACGLDDAIRSACRSLDMIEGCPCV